MLFVLRVTTGIYGPAKMKDGERICNLSVYVMQRRYTAVEVMKYDTERKRLTVNFTTLNSIIWPGNVTSMPAKSAQFQSTYTPHVFYMLLTSSSLIWNLLKCLPTFALLHDLTYLVGDPTCQKWRTSNPARFFCRPSVECVRKIGEWNKIRN